MNLKNDPEPPARLSVRQMLDCIDTYLAFKDDKSRDLWSVLSALRGPDSGDFRLKNGTTIPIRRAAFPKTTKSSVFGSVGASFGNPRRHYAFMRNLVGSVHFKSHANKAAKVLSLVD